MLKVNSAIFSGDCSQLITEEDMHSEQSEVVSMFCEFQAGLDTVDLDDGHMVLNGIQVQSPEEDVSSPRRDFTKEGYTQEESDLLNLWGDDVEDLIYALAKEKGLVGQPLVEEILFEDTPIKIEGADYERALEMAIPKLDEYFEASKKLDDAVDKTGWNQLRARRQMWWSHFQEEMDTNWLRLTAYEQKADRKLFLLERDGKAPTDEQWKAFMNVRKNIMRQCFDMQNTRYPHTRSIYEKAMAVTTQAREFWKTEQGQAINTLREIRSKLYQELTTPVLMSDGNVIQYWDLVSSYWQLREEDISPNFTIGDTSGVDDPEVVRETKSQIESLMDTHLLEESQIEKGDIYWMNWYDTWLTKRFEKRETDVENVVLCDAALLESIDEMFV